MPPASRSTDTTDTVMLHADYIVNRVFASRTYVLTADGSDDVWLVDCGDIGRVLDNIDGRRVMGVLLTHAHFDHIYGLPELLRAFPDCVICTNGFGVRALQDARLNMSKYHGMPVVIDADAVRMRVCGEGDSIGLFDGVEAVCHETPGHNPSCLTFEVGDCLFTGDAYIPDTPVVTVLPHADKAKARESVERILKLAEGRTVMPGHDDSPPEWRFSI